MQAWLREETMEWGSRMDGDVAAKEKDTEAVKQERQRDLIKLKVVVVFLHFISYSLGCGASRDSSDILA